MNLDRAAMLASIVVLASAIAATAAAGGPAVPGSGDSNRVVPESGQTASASAPADGGPVRATLKPSAVAEGDWVTLGDLVEFGDGDGVRAESLRGLRLWRAPMPGIERVVTSDDVAKRARNAGVPEGIVLEGAPDVRVTAAATTISGEKLVEFGRKELEARTDIAGATVVIEDPKPPASMTLRGRDVTLRAEVSPRKPWGLVPVGVEAWAAGKRQARVLLSFRVRARAMVPQLVRGLEPGAVVAEGDLTDVERDLSTVPDDAIRSREGLVGLTVQRAIQAGSYVRRGCVRQPAMVRKGGQVTLVARVGTVEARATAQSREDGASGDVVTVINTASKRAIRARVVSPEEVEAVVR